MPTRAICAPAAISVNPERLDDLYRNCLLVHPGTLVGFVHGVWDGGSHAFILDTVVHPDFQRRGIGRELVRAVTAEAFAAGCAWVHVDYEPELASFYQKACGFRPTLAGLRSADD